MGGLSSRRRGRRRPARRPRRGPREAVPLRPRYSHTRESKTSPKPRVRHGARRRERRGTPHPPHGARFRGGSPASRLPLAQHSTALDGTGKAAAPVTLRQRQAQRGDLTRCATRALRRGATAATSPVTDRGLHVEVRWQRRWAGPRRAADHVAGSTSRRATAATSLGAPRGDRQQLVHGRHRARPHRGLHVVPTRRRQHRAGPRRAAGLAPGVRRGDGGQLVHG
jgi:hypothetical protein